MDTSNKNPDATPRIGLGRILFGLFVLFLFPALILFGSSGNWNWGTAWVYLFTISAFSIVSRLFMLKKNPDLMEERANIADKSGVKPWDRFLMPLGIILGILMLMTAGLDERFEWTPVLPSAIRVSAFALIVLGYSLGTWATAANKFFSSEVRIQRDRGHTVVESGPYGLVRHPAYAGTIVTSLATPLLLGSLWALIPSSLAALQLIVRTAMEDRTLQEELEGYRLYAGRVRYRLLPGVW